MNDLTVEELMIIMENFMEMTNKFNNDTIISNREFREILMTELFSIVSKETTHNNTENREAGLLLHKMYKNDKDFKRITDKIIQKTKLLIMNVTKNKIPDISEEFFNKLLGDQEEEPTLQPDILDLEFKTQKFEDTSFTKYYKLRNHDEFEIIKSNKSLGNINAYNELYKLREQYIKKTCEKANIIDD
jgi:hypothetical protein